MNQINDKLPLRHPELKIPEGDPFEYDLLNRKENVEILTRLIESTAGPRVISVDANWGNGKTIFLKMWAQHLRKQKYAVVEFNAWETEFCKNPFIALYSELEIALNEISDSVKKDDHFNNKYKKLFNKDNQFKKKYKKLIKEVQLVASRLKAITLGYAELSVRIEIDSDLVKNKNIIEYKSAVKSLKKFKCSLEQTANKLSELDYKSLVIVIDELDRCSPSYALELLENAKHIFGVQDIVFILGINRSQLEHSIEALYGNEFDTQDYTRKYFDLDYKLPSPSRNDFIDNLVSKNNIENYFNSNINIGENSEFNLVKQMLHIFFVDSSVSLRTIEQTIQRMGVVCALTEKDRYYITVSVVLLILKTTDSKIYDDFVNGNINDLELVKKLPNIKRISHTQDYVVNWFEAIIIVIEYHINLPEQEKTEGTQLYRFHDEKFKEELTGREYRIKKQSHSGEIVEIFQSIYTHYDRKRITSAIQQIEFISEELLPSEK